MSPGHDHPSQDLIPGGRPGQTTQIYEGTSQIRGMVIAKKLFG